MAENVGPRFRLGSEKEPVPEDNNRLVGLKKLQERNGACEHVVVIGEPGPATFAVKMRGHDLCPHCTRREAAYWRMRAKSAEGMIPAPDPQPQDKGGDAPDPPRDRSSRASGPLQVAAGAGAEVKAPAPAQDLAGTTATPNPTGAVRDSSSVAPAAASTGRSDAHREPRSARFTVLADSEEATQDYILLDVPPAQALALFDKLQDVLAVAAEYGRREVLIGVHLEVEAHRQVYVDRDGTRSYPPSLLRDDIDSAPAPEKS